MKFNNYDEARVAALEILGGLADFIMDDYDFDDDYSHDAFMQALDHECELLENKANRIKLKFK